MMKPVVLFLLAIGLSACASSPGAWPSLAERVSMSATPSPNSAPVFTVPAPIENSVGLSQTDADALIGDLNQIRNLWVDEFNRSGNTALYGIGDRALASARLEAIYAQADEIDATAHGAEMTLQLRAEEPPPALTQLLERLRDFRTQHLTAVADILG
ncbi:MAG: hypothetical protein WA906_02950 [Pacificimonas sp.]